MDAHTPLSGSASTTTRAAYAFVVIALAIIYFWFGGLKFTAYEAKGLEPLVSNSPLIGWMYAVFSVRGFSIFLGVLEIVIGLLLLGRFVSPRLSMLGGLLSCGLFVVTVAMMATVPPVWQEGMGFPFLSVAPGQFLLKDIGLLAASFLILAESRDALSARGSALRR